MTKEWLLYRLWCTYHYALFAANALPPSITAYSYRLLLHWHHGVSYHFIPPPSSTTNSIMYAKPHLKWKLMSYCSVIMQKWKLMSYCCVALLAFASVSSVPTVKTMPMGEPPRKCCGTYQRKGSTTYAKDKVNSISYAVWTFLHPMPIYHAQVNHIIHLLSVGTYVNIRKRFLNNQGQQLLHHFHHK